MAPQSIEPTESRERRPWIHPGFPVAADPNEVPLRSFVGVWGRMHPSTTHAARKGCVTGFVFLAVIAILPNLIVAGALQFAGLTPIFILMIAALTIAGFGSLSEVILANYPGPLATREKRIGMRLLLLALFLMTWAGLRPYGTELVATLAHSELVEEARRRAVDRVLAGQSTLSSLSQEAFEDSARHLASTAIWRYWLLVAALALLFSAASLHHEWKQRVSGRKLDPGLLPATADKPLTTVAHVSDLHLTPPGLALVAGGPSGNEAFERVWHEARPALQSADHILVTGDLTDTGAGEEWSMFMRFIADFPPEKFIILPGNHDVNIIDRSKWYVEGESGFRRTVRLLRMIAAVDAVQGERALLVVGRGIVTLASHLDPYREVLAEFAVRPHRLRKHLKPVKAREAFNGPRRRPDIAYSLVAMLWEEIFPHAIEDPTTQLVFFVVNSNKLAGDIVSNAFGEVDEPQLARLKELFDRYGSWSKVILIHHHLALPPFHETLLNAFFARLMVLINAGDVLSLLMGRHEIAVFHGHRHVGFRGTIEGSIQVIAAPSTSLGDEATGEPPCVQYYDLHRSPAGGTVVVTSSRRMVSTRLVPFASPEEEH
jgi:3',5'-cyclic AMP phosphodiesterase CpdA